MEQSKKTEIELLQELDDCRDDTRKKQLLKSICDLYDQNQNYILSGEYGKKLLDLSEKSRDNQMILSAYYILGKSFCIAAMYDNALEYTSKGLNLSKTLKHKNFVSIFLNLSGIIYNYIDKKQEAMSCYEESLSHANEEQRGVIYHNIANIYFETGDYNKSLECNYDALECIKQTVNSNEKLMCIKYGIGVSYLYKKNYTNALKLLLESEKLANEMKDIRVTLLYCDLSVTYYHLDQLEKANEYLTMAEMSLNKHNWEQDKAKAILLLSNIYEERKDSDAALKFYKKYAELKDKTFTDKLSHNIAQFQIVIERERKELETVFQEKLSSKENEMKEHLKRLNEVYADIIGLDRVGFFSETIERIVLFTEKLHHDRSIPVLIEGETGTGKEIIARLIHFGKEKSNVPFVSINCSAISPSLFESELFGYEGGAFTGSNPKGSIGKLELAQGGTLFLDEIGDMPLEMQPKLLRVLQQKELYRIGGKKKIDLDVRVICATNQDLNTLIHEGKFRKDLFFRLNTAHIMIPSLQERREEIIPLARMFMQNFAKQKKKRFETISKEAEILLETKEWVGNIRELENTIEMAVMLNDDTELKQEHLVNDFYTKNKCLQTEHNIIIPFNGDDLNLEDIELEIIRKVLSRFGGNKSKAALCLGISTRTISRKLEQE